MSRIDLRTCWPLVFLVACVSSGAGDDDGGGGDGGGTGGDVRPPMTNGVSTLAGYSESGYMDGSRQVNLFNNPVNVALGPDGRLYVADFYNSKIRTVDMEGTSQTAVAKQGFSRPFGMAFSSGTLFISTDRDPAGMGGPDDLVSGTIWRFDINTRSLGIVASRIGRPRGIAVLKDGRLAVADYLHHVIQIVDPNNGQVTPLAGSWGQRGFADGVGSAARFAVPYGIVTMPDGRLLVADHENHRLRLVSLDGTVTTVAGGAAGYADGAGTSARFTLPQGLTIAANGDVYIAERGNARIRKYAGGNVTTVAGNGSAGYRDHDDRMAAELYGLEGLSVRPDGSVLFVADGNRGDGGPYHRIRMVKF
jgi:sugar lactone lactonase YvrE